MLAPIVEARLTAPSVSIVTTALPARLPYLRRLARQATWIADYAEWIICGPDVRTDKFGRRVFGELLNFSEDVGARYIECAEPIGTCRNLSADAAKGEIIVQFDDDDWQHPFRVEKQVERLTRRLTPDGKESSAEVVGSSWLYWLDAEHCTANRLSYWGSLHCLPGASLAYWRSSWFRHPFEPIQAEDGPFTSWFGKQGTCVDMRDPKLLVYMRHGDHAANQRDWWQETKSAARRLSPAEQMRQRIEHPSRRIALVESDTPRDEAIAHEQEISTVYVRHLMGEIAFEEYCRPPPELDPPLHVSYL